MERLCIVNNCNKKIKAKGYCDKHLKQIERHGRLTPEREHGTIHICKAINCKNKAFSLGYCTKHYQQIRKHGKLTTESK